jgi:hypothetical protein
MRVTVQAGCHLGVDPNNPFSTKKNSLLRQLDKLGWALPDLGGIAHQTVSGFLSTGSMGGTMQYNLGGALVGIRIIDGTGKVRDLAQENDEFYAAGVSMGLLGIVSTLTFQCEPRYNIQGRNRVSTVEKCPAPLFGRGKAGLEGFFEKPENQYTRLLWWPQQGVNRVDLWRGERTPAASRSVQRALDGGLALATCLFKRRPLVGTPRILQRLIVKPFFTFIAKVDSPPYRLDTEKRVRNVLCLFLRKKDRPFWDVWYKALPMDNHISDKPVPTEFTELFIDISQADKLMEALKQFFCPTESQEGKSQVLARTGTYAFEIYPGHQSRFWMSPSYGRHSVRLDVFWYRTDHPDDSTRREKFFELFWQLLYKEKIPFRVHWGKYLPKADSDTGAKYLREQYDKWDDFMKLRQDWDPKGIFLNTYWKEHLGLGSSSQDGQPEAPPELGFEGFAKRAQPPFLLRVIMLIASLKELVRRQPSTPQCHQD